MHPFSKLSFVQHDDQEVLIPQHISFYCLCSIQTMLLNTVVVYIYGFKALSFFTGCIYLSSIVFWSKVRHTGIEKVVDVVCVVTGGLYGTYVSFQLPRFYNMFWLCTVMICVFVFVSNELLFFFQVRIHYNKRINMESSITKYRFFSLKYTNPHTHEREMAYYRSTLVHGLFFHIIPSMASIYCIVHGSTQETK